MILVKAYASVGGNEITFVADTAEKYTLSLSDARKVGLYRYVEYPEELPAEADEEMLTFLSQKMSCIRYASYLLGFGDKSKKALSLKLKTKGYERDVCEAAIAVLESNGLVDDDRLCDAKVKSLAEGKLYGPRRIKSELIAKGFSSSQAENALDEADIDFDALLYKLVEKLSRHSGIPEDEKELQTFKNKLVRYGYGFDQITRTLRDFE